MASATNVIGFQSQEAKLNDEIEAQITALRTATVIALPKADSKLSQLYVQRIQGKYNVVRAKTDTDNAIDLLYIAYNTTPQAQGEIRVQISDIMHKLIDAQQQSELATRRAMNVAGNVLSSLENYHPDWQDVRECKGPEDTNGVKDIKDFLKSDLIELAKKIKEQALSVKKELDPIAATYDRIITETLAATSNSEKALAAQIKEKTAIEKEINEANAQREKLTALVEDLTRDVQKYDKLAREYESRANTAEERAFIMSIIQVGAQMLAAALPPIAMALTGAATGGTSTLASAAANTVKRAVGDKNSDTDADTAADKNVIETKKKVSEKQGEVKQSEKKVAALKKIVNELEDELKREENKPKPSSDKDKPKTTDKDKSNEKEESKEEKPKDKDETKEKDKDEPATTAEKLKDRLKKEKEELQKEEENHTALIAALMGLQDSLKALEKGLGTMVEKQDNTAAALREMQMKMLDKVETYEKERRTQNAELIKINALLKGKLSQEETISLAILSLNVSISALKRTKEIIEEIAFLFKSFADFMDQICSETQLDIERFDAFVGKETIRRNFFNSLIEGGDKFFLRLAGEWNAIKLVTERFCNSFADGWSKMNKLSGKYLTGDELSAYMKTASVRLEEIVQEREAASKQKIQDIATYKEQIRAKAMAS